MKSLKKIPSLNVLLTFFVLVSFFSCGRSAQDLDPVSIEDWILGTSVSIREEFSPETFLQIKEAGIEYAELGLRAPQFYADSLERDEFCRQVKEAASETGVKIWSIHIPYGKKWDISEPVGTVRQDVIKQHQTLFEIFAILQPEKAIIHPSFEPNPAEERETRFESCRKSLSVLASEAKTYGVELVIECLPRTCLGNSGEEILRLLEGNENLGVCCDVNHMLKETPEEFIQTVGSRITTLHISDYDGLDERHWPPGKGIINWNLVIKSLLAADYSGPFLLEYGDTPENKAAVWENLKSDFLQYKSKTI
ncbi:sugar phosphate isomerase/epimerase family protein [Acidobacteriota bacterium]